MTSLEKLIRHFEKFPGIGSRQARRFAFHLLTESKEDTEELALLIRDIKSTVAECPSCFRFFSRNVNEDECPVCANTLRDRTKLLIVERDSDIDALERSRMYDGLYFVLGGTVPLLDSNDAKKLRGGALKAIVEMRVKEGLSELILGFSVNPDGENTARYVETLLRDLIANHNISVNQLGRGLSTGSELEYADPETLKSAFENRKKIV
jgi:recombination protein RecR